MTTTEIKEIEIPAAALTTCPDRRYGLVSIAGCCQTCNYFMGLFDVMQQDGEFADKYRVRCGVPQAREIIVVDMGEPPPQKGNYDRIINDVIPLLMEAVDNGHSVNFNITDMGEQA